MNWTNFINQEPTPKDLPFVCIDKIGMFSEVWDDTDWFSELTDEDKAEWVYWTKLEDMPEAPPIGEIKEKQVPEFSLEEMKEIYKNSKMYYRFKWPLLHTVETKII